MKKETHVFACLLLVLFAAVAAGCGGAGLSESPGRSDPASVSVSESAGSDSGDDAQSPDVSSDDSSEEAPVFIENLTLEYEQVTDDPAYTQITGVNAPYHVRDEEDFQIGRLVRVVPRFTPADAAYKTLVYTVTEGAEYIQDFATYETEEGTCARFRVRHDLAAVGKSVRISAVSTGYVGEYADRNVSGTSEKALVVSGIPAEDFRAGVLEGGNWADVSGFPLSVRAGDSLTFDFIPESLSPSNATTRLPEGERLDKICVLSGDAEISEGEPYRTLRVSDGAKAGESIVIAAEIGGLRKEYRLQVVSVPVSSIGLSGGERAIPAGGTRTVSVSLLSEEGEPLARRAAFCLLQGEEICRIVEYPDDPGRIDVRVSPSAKGGDRIRLIATADGVVSAPLEFQVSPVAAEGVLLRADDGSMSGRSVRGGEEIRLSAQVFPENATYDQVVYKVVEEKSSLRGGKPIGDLDSATGLLKIGYTGRYPDRIAVVAEVNGVQSNPLVFSFEKVEVTDIAFVPDVSQMCVYPGDVIALDAAVNEDASVQYVEYFMHYGEDSGSLKGNVLTITDNIPEGYGNIGITVYSVDNPDIKTYLNVVIMGSMFQVRVNGKAEEVDVLSTEELVVTAVDSTGNPIGLEKIQFNVYNEDWKPVTILRIENDRIVFPENFYIVGSRTFILECLYQDEVSYIFLDIVSAPVLVQILPEKDGQARPGNEISFDIAAYPNYIGFADSLCVEVVSGNAVVADKDTIYIDPYALPGEEITVRAKWSDDKAHAVYSEERTLVVQSGIDSVEIVNMKEFLMLGETYRFEARYFPTNRADVPIKFYLANSYYSEYVNLDEDTGVIFVKDSARTVEQTIEIWCSTGKVRSPYYEITLLSAPEKISYTPSPDNQWCVYNEDRDVYLLERDGSLQFEASPIDKYGYGCSYETVRWFLDGDGTAFLHLSADGTVTVKENAPDVPLEARLFAYTENIVGEPVRIVIARGISSAEEFLEIASDPYGYYMLKSDIEFSRPFVPFPAFYGVLYGNLNLVTVSFALDASRTDYGLVAENYGVIDGIIISFSAPLEGYSGRIRYVGGIAAVNYGIIRDCSAGNGSFGSGDADWCTGGIAGLNEGLIRGCSNYTVIVGGKFSGGITGHNRGRIESSVNARALCVYVEEGEAVSVSGVAGYNEGTVTNSSHFEKVFIYVRDTQPEGADENAA